MTKTSKAGLSPFYEDVQAHYDLSDEFFFLFLDPNRVYSCAYFARDDMSLEEAQMAKIDLALGKLDLEPGTTLLDIGCGWGACCRRAAEHYGVNTIGLTLSKNQHAYVSGLLEHLSPETTREPGVGSAEVHIRGWEEFDQPVDRIVSIGAFEHFRRERYPAFFDRCHSILPANGRMLLHTIVWPSPEELDERKLPIEHEHVLFGKFIRKEIFPGGELCRATEVVQHSQKAGFQVTRVQSLREHYTRTLRVWAERLEENKEDAVAIAGQTVYDRYMKYMTGCARYFESGYLDVQQFTLDPSH